MSPVNNITTQGSASVSTQEAQEYVGKINEALKEIAQAKDGGYSQYYDMSDLAELELLEGKLKATLVTLNYFLKFGEWPSSQSANNGQNGSNAWGQSWKDLKPGWNGDETITTQLPPGYNLSSLNSELPEGAEFSGFLYSQNDNNPETETRIVWQASQDTESLTAFNHGRDIIFVEKLLDGTTRYFIGKDLVVNTDVQILIDAHNLKPEGRTQGLIADFHRVLRISDGSNNTQAGVVGGITVIGSDLADTITLTQGDDIATGGGGDDTLRGEGGADKIHGDWGYFNTVDPDTGQPITPDMVASVLGINANAAGNDIIDGGAGVDYGLYGDGGINYGAETDLTSGPNKEIKVNIQNDLPQTSSKPPPDSWFVEDQSQGWGNVKEVDNNTWEISETNATLTANSELVLQMGDYDNVVADVDSSGQGIILTFSKYGEDGSTQTFRVRIKGVLRDRTGSLLAPFTLKIIGNDKANIIDFHKINLGNNNFIAEGMAGNDMVIAPQNELNSHGWSLDDLRGQANRTPGSAIDSNLVNTVVPHKSGAEDDEQQPGVKVTHPSGSNEIVVSASNNNNGEPIHVSIDATGYDRSYVVIDPAKTSDLLLVLVKESPSGGDPTVLVIRIEKYQTTFQGDNAEAGDISWLHVDGSFTLTPLLVEQVDGQPMSGNMIDAGAGNDFVFQWDGDFVQNAEGPPVVGSKSGSGDNNS